MIIKDIVYGNIEITDPIIIDIINSFSIQRLKGVDQAGYSEPFFPGTYHSRFDHSVGTYFLLKKYKTSKEEQISGLIHDISHSAFSHCIDYVLDEGSEANHSYQDDIFNEFILKSEIPFILEKYGIDFNYIIDSNNFPLQERNLPDLCADRIDNSLRTACMFKEIKNANYFLNNLLIKDNNWIFANFDIAQEYAELFSKLNNYYFSGILSAVMFQTVGEYLKYAISKKYIEYNDLYKTDKDVLLKIKPYHYGDKVLDLLFKKMNGQVKFRNNPLNFDYKVLCKSRIIDPFFIEDKKIKRVSQVDDKWKEKLLLESSPKEYFIEFIK